VLSSVELTTAYLDRLESIGPKLGALVTLTRDLALAQAKQSDAERAAGQLRGPLHGIPYGAKDLLATTRRERVRVAEQRPGHAVES